MVVSVKLGASIHKYEWTMDVKNCQINKICEYLIIRDISKKKIKRAVINLILL